VVVVFWGVGVGGGGGGGGIHSRSPLVWCRVADVRFQDYTTLCGFVRRLDDVIVECMWGFRVRVHARLMALLCSYHIVLSLYWLRTCGIPTAWTRLSSRTCTVPTRLLVDRPWFVAQHKKPVLLLQMSETDYYLVTCFKSCRTFKNAHFEKCVVV
jgi:hypothetical protein